MNLDTYKNIRYIAFDADDTLWENEMFFRKAEQEFYALMRPFVNEEIANKELFRTEVHHLKDYGYGITSFMLSMIESAIKLSEHKILASDIQNIIRIGQDLLNHPVVLLDGVKQVVQEYAQSEYQLTLITKGTLKEQERKINLSGLKELFNHIEIVSEKTEAVYRRIFDKYKIDAERFVMIGNSLKSDILPVLDAGGKAIHIPHQQTWLHETVSEESLNNYNFDTLDNIQQLRKVVFLKHPM